jgi:hypothetical protein
LFIPLTFGIAAIGRIVGAPISTTAVWVAILIFSVLFLVPAFRGWGSRLRLATWNRAGFIGGCVYIALAVFAHHQSLERIQRFAEFQGVKVQSIGALPFPPSLWNWDGLIRAERGVYQISIDLSQSSGIPNRIAGVTASAGSASGDFSYKYFPDAHANPFIDQARRLPEVQKVLWFDRFPVTRWWKLSICAFRKCAKIVPLHSPIECDSMPRATSYPKAGRANSGYLFPDSLEQGVFVSAG